MNPVVCVSGVDLLIDYLEGELPADVRDALDAHVAGCARCAAFIESYQAATPLLRRATAATLSDDLAASLLAALRAKK